MQRIARSFHQKFQMHSSVEFYNLKYTLYYCLIYLALDGLIIISTCYRRLKILNSSTEVGLCKKLSRKKQHNKKINCSTIPSCIPSLDITRGSTLSLLKLHWKNIVTDKWIFHETTQKYFSMWSCWVAD